MSDAALPIALQALGLGTSPANIGAVWSQSPSALKTRLQQALASARLLLARPWIAPGAWTTGEAVKAGDVRKNSAGQLFVCVIAGTCGSAEPVTYTSALSNDGGAQWSHLGGPQWDTANDPAAPTLTNTGTGAPSGLSVAPSTIHDYYGLFTFRGCSPYYDSANSRVELRAFESKAGSYRGQGTSVAFWCDAPKLGLYVTGATQGVGIMVDGRPLTLGAVGSGLASGNWFSIDWAYRKARLYELMYTRDIVGYQRVLAMTASDQVWAYRPPVTVRGAFIGDSYLAGSSYGPFLPGNILSQHFGRRIGIDDMWCFGTGGTGLLNTNVAGGGPFYTYRERLPQVLATSPDVIFVYGSTNDGGYTQAQVRDEALLFLDAIRAATNAPVFWFGHASLTLTSNADAGVAEAVALRPDSNIFYKSMMSNGAGELPWITGSYNNTGKTFSSNNSQYISADGTHPVDKGTMYFVDRMVNAYTNDMLPLVA